MPFRILYHHLVVQEDLPRIPKNLQQRIRSAIENRLLTDPVSFGDPLRQSLQGHRKLRVGDYRIIYRIDGENVIILKIGHRKDIYTKALRFFNK